MPRGVGNETKSCFELQGSCKGQKTGQNQAVWNYTLHLHSALSYIPTAILVLFAENQAPSSLHLLLFWAAAGFQNITLEVSQMMGASLGNTKQPF